MAGMSDEPIHIEESEVNALDQHTPPWEEGLLHWEFIQMQRSAKTDQMQAGSKVLYKGRIFAVTKREELGGGTIKFDLWGPQS